MAQSFVVPVCPQRWVILHYHIFKNAGTTIEYFLERTFGDQWASVNGPDPSSVLKSSDVEAFLQSHPELVAISSHHLKYPKPVIPGTIVFDLCYLRDPLQRLWSMYQYLRRSDPVDELSDCTKSLEPPAFFERMIEDHPQLVNDCQVTMLANRGEYTRPPSEPDLRIALDVVRDISVLGVVDCFEESAITAEYFLRPAFPKLQFQYVRQNVTPRDHSLEDPGQDGFRHRVRDAIYEQLVRMNRLDTLLVDAARREVERRWGMLPSREARREDFRERCRILQDVHQARAHVNGTPVTDSTGPGS